MVLPPRNFWNSGTAFHSMILITASLSFRISGCRSVDWLCWAGWLLLLMGRCDVPSPSFSSISIKLENLPFDSDLRKTTQFNCEFSASDLFNNIFFWFSIKTMEKTRLRTNVQISHKNKCKLVEFRLLQRISSIRKVCALNTNHF